MSTDIEPYKNFLGIPVAGYGTERSRTNQRPLSELEPLISAVLADPTISAFGWNQYTPYFNDGDVCEFSVGTPWFRTTDMVKAHPVGEPDEDYGFEDDDDEEYTVEYGGHPTLGKRDYEYEGRWPDRRRIDLGYQGPDEARFDRCLALSHAISGGEFEDVLLEAFGDHARVKVTRERITVDTYEHD